MDDESGWNEILVDGWGPLVRAAVCDRVDDALQHARGVLAIAVTTPDDAPAPAVERVHDAIVAAIGVETGADLDALGSQAAWATYDDVWAELGRRWDEGPHLTFVPALAEPEAVRLLHRLPTPAVELAGALRDGRTVRVVRAGTGFRLDLAGLFRWLATEEGADDDARSAARDLVALIRAADRTPDPR